MCGICGIVTNDPGVTINQKLIEDMTETLRHRGPDDVGTYNIGGCALGMRRPVSYTHLTLPTILLV